MNRRLIINADDFGMSSYVNNQIEECIKKGVITSSTIMANAPAFEDAVRIAKQYPDISFGVHLNLIQFAPLTNTRVFAEHGILDKSGEFIEGAIKVVSIDDDLRRAVFEEWDAQISRIEANGIVPTHCDSHEHTHTIPGLRSVLCEVLERHKINKVRMKVVPSIRLMIRLKKQGAPRLDKSKAMLPKRRNVFYRRIHLFVIKYIAFQWNRFMRNKFTMTDGFCSFNEFLTCRSVLHLGGKSSLIEVMCHPGNIPYQKETDELMKGKSWLPRGYTLVSYKDF